MHGYKAHDKQNVSKAGSRTERERERERGLMKWGIGSRMLALGADGKRETNL